jgi:ABC-type bacteriocin/lantibiotic exporter with double-glycine peptidase domain
LLIKELLFNSQPFILIALLALLVWGCSPFKPLSEHVRESGDTVRLEVPYVPQARDNDCGPAALSSVLAYYENAVILKEITDEIYIPSLGRTLLPDMENFARARDFETFSGRGDIEQLKQAINSGKPVIVFMEASPGLMSRPHYIVVTGYTPNGFISHVGVMEDAFIDIEDFDQRWQAMNRLHLIIWK